MKVCGVQIASTYTRRGFLIRIHVRRKGERSRFHHFNANVLTEQPHSSNSKQASSAIGLISKTQAISTEKQKH